MARRTIPMDLYIEASRVFHWASKRHYQLWFTGSVSKRHRRSETVLQRLVKKGKLKSYRLGSKLIYTVPKKGRTDEFSGYTKINHGLACTEGLVRFYRSRIEGVVIAERFFYGCGSVPEWGIIYPEGAMLLFEYSTKHNFFLTGNMNGKLTAYKKNMRKIAEKFNTKPIVVFAIDIPKDTLERFVLRISQAGSVADAPSEGGHPLAPVFFVDYKSFLKVPIGEQLTAPIYIWGADGKKYALRQNV